MSHSCQIRVNSNGEITIDVPWGHPADNPGKGSLKWMAGRNRGEKATLKMCHYIIAGMLHDFPAMPPGVERDDYDAENMVKLSDLLFDRPALDDPHWEKRLFSIQVGRAWRSQGLAIKSPMKLLTDTTGKTVEALVKFVYDSQAPLK